MHAKKNTKKNRSTMSKLPPPEKPLTRPQNIQKLKQLYLYRFVDTPLSFWDDGSTIIKDSDDYYILGRIYALRVPRRKKSPVICHIHFAPTKDEPEFRCDIELDVAMEMMHDKEFKCWPGTFLMRILRTTVIRVMF